ncbi:excinuclease ABC subunit UvrA [Entomospira entomophila]|uniref:UvrABC system protein A n=1 Tax=Entomospira entomophila TaxID=2719988 RepID=A0A968KQV4_9SPIO|nr:excinuclease ABC subunit UvrA [Entomospira entomophilus]NIZ40093.1 excinuclease ABC subunit UvrA [Entomospira entomophilus]WDI35654.1 excinuclease ABC subunit UvrA [Entomospira entomophilus]
MQTHLIVKGAREHNLKNIDIAIPRDKLVVVSGVSGSGKSSLVFDTIFAEGQRRYVESLSSYARQFLGRMEKPDVDYIEGLSPAISIEQKTTGRNPRSTVGTITEIYDYLRLLYARVGTAVCPKDNIPIASRSLDQIIDDIMAIPDAQRVMILAPLVRERKGEHTKIFSDAKAQGFVRVRVDGVVVSLEEDIALDKKRKHSIEVVIDRLKLDGSQRSRLSEGVQSALSVSSGQVIVAVLDESNAIAQEVLFSEHASCPKCGFSMPAMEPRLFSFNNPAGACNSCAGLGETLEFDMDLIIPNREISFNEGGFAPYNPETNRWYRSIFESLAKHYGFTLDTPIAEIDTTILKKILYGTGSEVITFRYENVKGTNSHQQQRPWEGIVTDLKRRHRESTSDSVKEWFESFMRSAPCEACKGARLRPEALAVQVGGKNILSITQMSIDEELHFVKQLTLSAMQQEIAREILKEILDRLTFMSSVGLGYLSLTRTAGTLSGGESQRIRLATQIGSSLMGVLYILDEPTIGLHQRDNDRLLQTLKRLRDLGNTLIVVEHDEQVIREADYLIDIGPAAGVHGGEVVAYGTPAEVSLVEASPTGRYLRGTEVIAVPTERRSGNGFFLMVQGATHHNLKNISVSFPLGTLSVITGVSGSGKSTLLNDIISPYLHNHLNRAHMTVGKVESIAGIEHLDNVITIDQSPIGRTPRSNPATYVGVWTPIRELFAELPASKAMGFKSGRFSFNVKGGRCESCEGSGVKKIEMHFLPDVFVKCDVCQGTRFNHETLQIRYREKSIHDILQMTVEDAYEFFQHIPKIERKLAQLIECGLDYITLGQSALTLSGGEAQRVKLALELSKRSTGKTCYIIDEPTTGLHFLDVKKLLVSLQSLVDKGNTILMIEHNLDVIKCADYVVDLGPEGGEGGGSILVTGTPEVVSHCKESSTGLYVKPLLEGLSPLEQVKGSE